MSQDEERLYLLAASQPLQDVAALMLETGVRPEEIFRLRREDININIAQGYFSYPFGKTKAARRKIPLTVRASTARCALETRNAGQVRINKIQDIIGECKYSIHDLSRTESDKVNNLPRFNMPLELGLDLGCKIFGKDHEQEKVILVMDVEPFRYQKFISDIAGQDIYVHNGDENEIIKVVREWLRPELNPRKVLIPSGTQILQRFQVFQGDLDSICANLHWDRHDLEFVDYSYSVAAWVSTNRL